MSEPGPQEAMKFEILKAFGNGPRLAKLAVAGRKAIETPNFVTVTSRGTVPHVTPDNLTKHDLVNASYFGLEDFIELHQKNPARRPPIFQTPPSKSGASPLYSFTGTPLSTISVLAPRRIPAVTAPMGNGNDFLSVFTSTGFRNLTVGEYASAIDALRPDVAIAMADLTYGNKKTTPLSKRAIRMAERSDDWIHSLANALGQTPSGTALFAPTLPLPYSTQWEYLETLSEMTDRIRGLAVYDVDIIPDLKDYPPLLPLPRLSLDAPVSPHHILRQVALGADILALPLLNTVSDSGVALTFTFPPPPPSSSSTSPMPLGIDLSHESHQTALAPLMQGCTCYACAAHHRAYVNHLLSAREMLAWTLLQIHNHHVLNAFFAGVRASLRSGEEQFEADREAFMRAYEPEVPAGSGSRPRARGYHLKSAGGDDRLNKSSWGKYGDGSSWPEPEPAAGGGTPAGMDGAPPVRSTTETPLVPEGDATELDQKGFAEIDR
ncbi:uncharacterized protein E0L32_009787 [Thyridium curvatum]|uniref:Queuine tRNA-ribosyltransferase accessory subunit 2 n=1 Tax=Thyridium curvatum TaxID=1093900 RepID=A0A507AG96_9PEZI|nr:uncharacterized protein E0L32_009787 [Thyridium curvatum]TPX08725.1 hypothetical protein E0L32_009787 [Thyridium curvatum]